MGFLHRSSPCSAVALATAAATAAATGALMGWGWRHLRRVEVAGTSMLPTLMPGDRLVVVASSSSRVRPGDLVVLGDPRDGRPLVKRVVLVEGGQVEVAGDNPGASTDSRLFGGVPIGAIAGRAVYRYWPPERVGRIPAGAFG